MRGAHSCWVTFGKCHFFPNPPVRSSWSFAGVPWAQRLWMAEARSGTGQLQEQKKGREGSPLAPLLAWAPSPHFGFPGSSCLAPSVYPLPLGRAGSPVPSVPGLLIAVSASVDKIISHFGAARNLVQKVKVAREGGMVNVGVEGGCQGISLDPSPLRCLQAQLGDSRLSPDVGHLVLTTLCPALHALVADGLKPFRKDLITGQRRSSPWSVVEASVKPGGPGGSGVGGEEAGGASPG